MEDAKVKDSAKLLEIADKKVKNLGDLVDLPMPVFEEYANNKLNVGQVKMLKDQFRMIYCNLVQRKDALLDSYKKANDPSKKDSVEDLVKRTYLVLQRLEARIIFLENKEKKLLDAI